VKSWQPCRRHGPHEGCRLDPFTTPTPTPSPLEIPNAVTLADPCAIDSSENVKCTFSAGATLDVTGIDHVISASSQCAVSRAGSVACWPPPSGSTPLAATQVEGITDAVQIVSGTAHHCARTKRGGVACWGKNRLGQLGDGTRTSRTAPAPVSGLANVVEIAAGLDFTCARTKAGAVSCWGANASGALGDGSGRDQLLPVPIHGVADAVELAATNLHACVRRKNHHVACWGHSNSVSSGPAEEHVTVPEPETIE
jgi:alpha-tubulin suppressor-like RCC1 family protein